MKEMDLVMMMTRRISLMHVSYAEMASLTLLLRYAGKCAIYWACMYSIVGVNTCCMT